MIPKTKSQLTNRRPNNTTSIPSTFKKTLVGAYTTVSDSLRTSREQQRMELSECAQTLDIQEKYVRAIEQSQYSQLPGEVYIRLWVKKYAQFLGLDVPTLMINYEKERAIRDKIVDRSGNKETRKREPIWSHIKLWHIGVSAIILAITAFMGFSLYRTLGKPSLSLNLPASMETQEASVMLEGKTNPGAIFSINQQSVLLSTDGHFKEELSLHEGINTFTVESRKKHGFTLKREFQIIKKSLPNVITNQQGNNN